jgi:hypothetical protein
VGLAPVAAKPNHAAKSDDFQKSSTKKIEHEPSAQARAPIQDLQREL